MKHESSPPKNESGSEHQRLSEIFMKIWSRDQAKKVCKIRVWMSDLVLLM
jgi:hypothetical protein